MFAGEDITRVPAHEIVGRGIALSPEGRRVFPRMTVRENLDLGAHRRRGAGSTAEDLDRVFELFPRLKEREKQKAGTMSGGEQQMLAIGRALMARPQAADARRAVDGDRPDPGAADLRDDRRDQPQGVAILLVEQNANYALDVSKRGYVLETGRVVLTSELRRAARRPRGAEGVPGDMTLYRVAAIGAKALYLLFIWLAVRGRRLVAVGAQGLRGSGGADVRTDPVAVGLLIVLLLPGRPGSAWKTEGWLPRRKGRSA